MIEQNTKGDELKTAEEIMAGVDTDLDEFDANQTDTKEDTRKDEPQDEQDTDDEYDESIFKLGNEKAPDIKTKKSDAEVVREATINKAIEKITVNGDIDFEALDNLPEWVKQGVNSHFATLETAEKQPSIDDLVDKAITKRTDEQEFQNLLPVIVKDNKLNKAQQAELGEKFKKFISYGMPKTEALLEATLSLGYNTKQAIKDAQNQAYKRGTMKLPPQGKPPARQSTNTKNISDDAYVRLTDEQIINDIAGRKVFK